MAQTLVVGYDGSPESQAALAYASDQVSDTGKLYLVAAVQPVPDMYGMPESQRYIDAAHSRGQRLLDEALERVPDGTPVETELIEDRAADAIVAVANARDADAIVIGSRGLGRVRAILGSVSHDVLHRASGPVIVIPAERG